MFVCTLPDCRREVPNPYEQYAIRVEVRRLDGNDRPFVRQVALICRDCIAKVDPDAAAQEVFPI